MHDELAFRILGLEPTVDREVVRKAYVRLARIYHPDRYIGEAEDVRAEAQRLMQRVTNAYAYVCSRQRELRSAPAPEQPVKDPWELAKRYRDAITQRASGVLEQKARHARWDKLEHEALTRAEREAELSSMFSEAGVEERPAPSAPVQLERGRSNLEIRLEQARERSRRTPQD